MKYNPPAGITANDSSALFGLIYGLQNVTTGNAGSTTIPAGDVGEFVTSTVPSGSAVALTTATGKDVTTIALTPGKWMLRSVVNRTMTGATVTQFASSISLTANTMSSQAGGSGLGTDPAAIQVAAFTTVSGNYTQEISEVPLDITANTTVHLVVQDTFSAGTISAFGTLNAVRRA